MIRKVSMVATLVAVLGMPPAASASVMDGLPDACQAALLARRIAFLRCNIDCSRRPDDQQALCKGFCLQRNAYRSAFVLGRPVCDGPQSVDTTDVCAGTSGMCTCKGETPMDAAESCIKLLLGAKCASTLTCMGTECVCIAT